MTESRHHYDMAVKARHAIVGSDPVHIVADVVILVRGGRIIDIRPRADIEYTADEVIDASRHMVIPGLVNIHTHAILSMVRGVAEDMGFAPAYTLGVPHGHDVRPDEAIALARLGALEALLFGSTLINDSYVHQQLTMPAMAELGLRVWGSGRIHDVDFSRVHLGEWKHDPEIGNRTLEEAVALVACMHQPGDPRTGVQLAAHAPDTCSRDLLREVASVRDRLGLRVTTHLAQSTVEVRRIRERDGCTPAELLADVGLLDDRMLAVHCIHLEPSDVELIGRASVHVAHVPKGNATGGTIAPTSRLRRAGARLALGTDNMHADMVEVMRWALNVGRIQEGAVTDFWQPQEVFNMATMGGARAMGLESEIGSIEPGKQADLVTIDTDRPHLVPDINPLGNLVHTAQGRDVDTVIVGGRVVVRGGLPVLVDMDEVLRDARAAAGSLWSRA